MTISSVKLVYIPEVLEAILSYLHTADLAKCQLVSKLFYGVSTPRLYRDVVLRSPTFLTSSSRAILPCPTSSSTSISEEPYLATRSSNFKRYTTRLTLPTHLSTYCRLYTSNPIDLPRLKTLVLRMDFSAHDSQWCKHVTGAWGQDSIPRVCPMIRLLEPQNLEIICKLILSPTNLEGFSTHLPTILPSVHRVKWRVQGIEVWPWNDSHIGASQWVDDIPAGVKEVEVAFESDFRHGEGRVDGEERRLWKYGLGPVRKLVMDLITARRTMEGGSAIIISGLGSMSEELRESVSHRLFRIHGNDEAMRTISMGQ